MNNYANYLVDYDRHNFDADSIPSLNDYRISTVQLPTHQQFSNDPTAYSILNNQVKLWCIYFRLYASVCLFVIL